MTNLNNIISTFSSEEEQRFIVYLERKNKRKDTKNIKLFKLLIKNELSSKEICFKLYKKDKKEVVIWANTTYQIDTNTRSP